MEALLIIAVIIWLLRKIFGGNVIVKTKIVHSSYSSTATSELNKKSAVARGAVGGLLLGPIGAVAGAATAKRETTVTEHHKTTFVVYYKNGKRSVETVSNDSDLYKQYIKKLDVDD